MRKRRQSGCRTRRHRIACSAGTPVDVVIRSSVTACMPYARGQVLLEPIREQDACDRPGISRLHARHDPLNVIPLVGGAAGMTLDFRRRIARTTDKIRRICAATHRAVGQIRIQGQPLAAVTADAAKHLHRMRCADFAHVAVARQAVLRLRGQAWDEHHRWGLVELDPPCGCDRAKENDRAESTAMNSAF